MKLTQSDVERVDKSGGSIGGRLKRKPKPPVAVESEADKAAKQLTVATEQSARMTSAMEQVAVSAMAGQQETRASFERILNQFLAKQPVPFDAIPYRENGVIVRIRFNPIIGGE